MPTDIGTGPTGEKPRRKVPAPDPVGREASLRARAAETDTVHRQLVSQEIAKRVSHFSQDVVTKHPKTVAGLVKSSLSTQKLETVAKHLDGMWTALLARNTRFAALHD